MQDVYLYTSKYIYTWYILPGIIYIYIYIYIYISLADVRGVFDRSSFVNAAHGRHRGRHESGGLGVPLLHAHQQGRLGHLHPPRRHQGQAPERAPAFARSPVSKPLLNLELQAGKGNIVMGMGMGLGVEMGMGLSCSCSCRCRCSCSCSWSGSCTLLYSALLCSALLYCTVLFVALLYSTLPYSSLLYYNLLYSTILYSTLPYSTLLYPTLLYSTLLYSTLLFAVGVPLLLLLLMPSFSLLL